MKAREAMAAHRMAARRSGAPRSVRAPRLWLLEDRRLGRGRLEADVRRLGHEPDLVIHRPDALLTALRARLPAVAIIDLSHANRDRLWMISALGQRFPEIRVMAVVRGADRALARRLELLGADVVCSGAGPTARDLEAAIRRGRLRRPRRPAGALPRLAQVQIQGLTPRERQVLGEIGEGGDNLKTAAMLGISERTVKVHVTSLFRKLGASNRVELALAARALT